jgi:hypothetical protein
MDSSRPTKAELLSRLRVLIAAAASDTVAPEGRSRTSRKAIVREADAIITHIEVNGQHGVGALTSRLFAGYPNILSIRSANYYNGEQDFGELHLCLSHEDPSRDAVFQTTLNALGENTVRRVLCVPYFADDVRNALAIKEIFGVPMCTYLMDDQNVCVDGIPDDLMRELLAKSALRLGISPELCFAYELKYGCKIHFLPPVVTARYIQSQTRAPEMRREGVIIGNIWGQRWLDLLRETVRHSGVTLRWYSNGNFRWLNCSKEDLVRDGIIPHEGAPVPDEELVEILRQAPFAVVPTGVLDDTDDRRFIAWLSLPSRIPYIVATSHAPIVVLGDPRTGAARFVEQHLVGVVAPYKAEAFRAVVDDLLLPEVNLGIRRMALALAGRFTDVGTAEWIWQSLARGEPLDRRYEDMLPKIRPELTHLFAR